jgi:hypothetical protein
LTNEQTEELLNVLTRIQANLEENNRLRAQSNTLKAESNAQVDRASRQVEEAGKNMLAMLGGAVTVDIPGGGHS